MPDPLHPASPVIPAAPARPVDPVLSLTLPLHGSPFTRWGGSDAQVYNPTEHAVSLGLLPPDCLGRPLSIAEPCAAAPVGDRWPCHLFALDLPEPLPPVLRADRSSTPLERLQAAADRAPLGRARPPLSRLQGAAMFALGAGVIFAVVAGLLHLTRLLP